MAVSTVGSGKTYATLAAWDAAVAANASETAQCYSGADLGGLNSIISSKTRVIDVAPGHQHNGRDAGTAGVAYSSGDISVAGHSNTLTIRGIRFQAPGLIVILSDDAGLATWLMENCLIVADLATDPMVDTNPVEFQGLFADGAPQVSVTVRNNIAYCHRDEGSGTAFVFRTSDVASFDISTYNNTVLDAQGTMAAGLANMGDSGAFTSWTCSNNLVCGFASGCITGSGADGSSPSTGTKNLTSDTTSTAGGLTSGIINTAVTHEVVNAATNATLKVTASAVNAGATIGSFSTDALGVARPQGAAWDIGALELIPITAVARAWRAMRFWSH